jgi:hypothetical protein
VLFAAFLGYNPMRQLLGSLLGHLPAGHAAYVTGRQFFPHLIITPFKDGLGVAFAFAIAASLIAAIASLLTGPRPRAGRAESLGAELAAVAGDGGLEPSELVVPDPAAEAPGATGANGPPTGPNGQPPGANGTNGQPTAITESGRKKPG